jgi:ACR3 family arsenite efflux pump ArsB
MGAMFRQLLNKYLPAWVGLDLGLALVVGWTWPGVAWLERLVPLFLLVMLFPMMINLRVEAIGRAVKSPRLLLIAVAMNFVLTPLLGYAWAGMFLRAADPHLISGFILKTLVPGSGMVAAWTGYARGRVESALIIVAVSLLLSLVLVPLWMWFLAGAYVTINPLVILRSMVLIVILPLTAGLLTRKGLVRKIGPERFQHLVPVFPSVSAAAMLPMIFIIISSQARLVLTNYQSVFLVLAAMASLYPLLFGAVILFSRLAKVDHGDCMALGYSVTAKAHAITIGLATTAFPGTLAVLPAAVAPMIQVTIMLLFLKLSHRIGRFLAGPGAGVVSFSGPAGSPEASGRAR